MDLSQLPSLGVAGALVLVIGYLLASNRTDRAQHREAVAALVVQHAESRAADRAELAKLRQRVDDLEAEVDLERDSRRRAEDLAAESQRRYAARIIEGRAAGDQPAITYLEPPA